MNTKELFEQITSNIGWNDELDFTPEYARVLICRHNDGTLSDRMYAKIFHAFNYYKQDNWIKK